MTNMPRISEHQVKLDYERKQSLYSQRLIKSIGMHPLWLSVSSSSNTAEEGGCKHRFTCQAILVYEHPTPGSGNRMLNVITPDSTSISLFFLRVPLQHVAYWRASSLALPPMVAASLGDLLEWQMLPERPGTRLCSSSVPDAITCPPTAAWVPQWAVWTFRADQESPFTYAQH